MGFTLQQTIEKLVKICDDHKATDIRVYDVQEFSPLTDFVVLCSVKNNIHLSSTARTLITEYKTQLVDHVSTDFYQYPHQCGESESGWIAVDFNACVFHVMTEESRAEYRLDELFEKRGVAFYF
jgi:ribosome-associated protein